MFSILILAIRNGASLFGGKYFYILLNNKFHITDCRRFDEPRKVNAKRKKKKTKRDVCEMMSRRLFALEIENI